MIGGVSWVLAVLFMKETYSPVLLSWKRDKLIKATGNKNLKTIYDITEEYDSVWSKLKDNIIRPFELLFGHPMIYGLGIFMAFLFGFFYLILISFPSAWGDVYGFKIYQQGLMYLSFGVAFCIFPPFWSVYTDKDYQRRIANNGGVAKPEFRLSMLYWCGIFCPIGLLIYGWCVQYKTFWFFPCIGIFLYAGFYNGMFSFLTNYVVDMNPRFSASSSAALAVFRSIFGFVFPIFAPKMYSSIGYGWGSTIFALIGLALGVPFPLYVFKYGEGLRTRANLKFDKKHAERDAKRLAKLNKGMEEQMKTEERKIKGASSGSSNNGDADEESGAADREKTA